MQRETLGLLLGVVGVVIFGGTLPATRLAVSGLDPWFVTFGRAAAAGLIAAVILLALRRPRPKRQHFVPMLCTGSSVIVLFPGFMAMAMTTLPASHGGIVLAIIPILTAIAGTLILGERPSPMFWLSAAGGMALVLAFALRGSEGGLSTGNLYLVIAAISAALGYTFSGSLSREMPGWEVICWVLAYALPATLPLAFWLAPDAPACVPAIAWYGFAYAALFSMLIGFFAWNAGLAMGGVARVSQTQLLQTFVTVALAAWINREPVAASTWAFAAGVVAIILLSRISSVRR